MGMRSTLLISFMAIVFPATSSIAPSSAKQFPLFGKPLNVFGFASQSVQISLKGNHYHVEQGVQQALLTVFGELDYRPRHNMTFYVSGLLTMDLVYDLKHDDRSWNEKFFSQSRSRMYIDDRDWQFLKECHLTWKPGYFLFRAGKQIVSWGEMDFFRIMDQINPIDERRGFSDVEFETTIIPTWLVRAEWWPQLNLRWLEEAGLQFVFNPNIEFIPNQGLNTGNDYGGIWSAAAEVPNPVYDQIGIGTPTMYLGRPDLNRVVGPDNLDDAGFEYALRLSLMIKGSLLTLNAFYGLDNSPQLLLDGFVEDPLLSLIAGQPVPALGTASDGTSIVYPIFEGVYPRQKFVGITWTGNLPILITALGGVNPLIRTEVRYQFDKSYTDASQAVIIESDFLDTGIGLDWKVKIPALNPRAFFSVMPQFFYKRILDYPEGIALNDHPEKDDYAATLVLSTSYIKWRIVPQVALAYLFNTESHLIIPSLTYLRNDRWHYALEAAILGGQKPNTGLWLFRKNDYIAFKVKFNWG